MRFRYFCRYFILVRFNYFFCENFAMKKRMISLVSLILLLCIPCSWLFTHSKYFYDTFENLYIDKIYNLYNSTSFSLFTSVVNIFASVTCIYLVPFYVSKIIDPNFEFGKKTKHLIVIVRRNYLLVFLFVLFVIFPVAIIGNIPIKEAFKECFLGPNIFAHFLSPFLFLLGTCFL